MAYEELPDTPKGRYEELPDAPKARGPQTIAEMRDAQMAVTGPAMENLRLGGIRGAGSIGATLLAPYDAIKDALTGKGFGLSGNNERRAAMDEGLRTMGADTESGAFKGGKLGLEVAGTLGVGGGLGKLAGSVPMLARSAAPLVDAIGSSGFSAAGMTGIPGLAVRAAGGAITGGASAGLIDPKDTPTGALIGGVAPLVVKGAGAAGTYIGDKIAAGNAEKVAQYSRNQPLNDTLRAGIDAGYVVPPSSVKPSFMNTTKESFAGKIATAQDAATRNQTVTDNLVRKSLGLPADSPLSVEVLSNYRAAQHAAGYDPMRNLGAVPAGQSFDNALTAIGQKYTGKGTIPAIEKQEVANLIKAHRSQGFDSADAVDAIRILREDAADLYRTGNSALGGAKKALANAYEDALEKAAPAGSDLLKNYQAARQNIAKTFTIKDALKEGTGNVDARKLASALQAGEPLSGDLLTAARFASAFPKATQPPSLVAGPGVHNMKAMFASGAGATGGTIGAMLAGPVGAGIGSAIGAGGTLIVPPVLRSQMFSKGAQQGLIQQAPGAPGLLSQMGLLGTSALQQPVLQSAPAIGRGLLSVD